MGCHLLKEIIWVLFFFNTSPCAHRLIATSKLVYRFTGSISCFSELLTCYPSQRNFLCCCEVGESFQEHFVLLTSLVGFSSLLSISRQWLTPDKNFHLLFVANAVLESACERAIVGDLYCDIPLGLYIIRGENVVLIGELVCLAFPLNTKISLLSS